MSFVFLGFAVAPILFFLQDVLFSNHPGPWRKLWIYLANDDKSNWLD